MTRPLRLEFAGALYHLTARGDRQDPIFEDYRMLLCWRHDQGES